MAREFDLFGNPLPLKRGQPGRNDHVPTAENAKKIRMLLVARWTIDAIAQEIGISAPTLRKHYFRNGKVNVRHAREMAVAELKGRVMIQLDQAAEAGNVGAMKELRKIAEAAELTDLPAAARPKKPESVGVKEQRRRQAAKPKGGWKDRLPGLSGPH